ncbi:MAG: hypothetical protein Q8N81_04525, partial [bacterium]|nr:hypothetical protein [bacterium]
PSGVRLGTPALTTRGMKESEMRKVGDWIVRALQAVSSSRLPGTKEERLAYLAKFKKDLETNTEIKKIRQEVRDLCSNFPVPGIE